MCGATCVVGKLAFDVFGLTGVLFEKRVAARFLNFCLFNSFQQSGSICHVIEMLQGSLYRAVFCRTGINMARF